MGAYNVCVRVRVCAVGPIGCAMCQLPCDDVHATIDDVDATIYDVDVTIGSVMNFVFSKSFCLEFGFRVGGLGGEAQPPSLVQTGEISRDNHGNAIANRQVDIVNRQVEIVNRRVDIVNCRVDVVA